MSISRILIIAVFVAAALIRLVDVFRPIDKPSWRECDEGSIARNFVQEGMNPLLPRIDWRGDGPGYAEMELPLFPYVTAVTYQIFGIHDEIGRIWSFLFSLGTLFVFFRLAREYLRPFAAIIAFVFFAFNPLTVEMATSIQPEGLMLLTYVASVLFFVRWINNERSVDYWLAAFSTALTLSAKAPAAHIGIFFGILLIKKYGWGVLREAKVWIFGIVAVVPAALWYSHARNLWLTYGNSLGVSNEYHWIGWDFFTKPDFIEGIFRQEFVHIWLVFGIVAGIFALWCGRKEEIGRHSLYWFASIFAFYIIAARTASEDWAYYYHVFSIAPMALLMGLAVKKLGDLARYSADTFSRRSLPGNLARIAAILIVAASMLATLLLDARNVRANYHEHRAEDAAFVFAGRIRPKLTESGLIVASGGHCVDRNGYVVAYNASFMFYWLNRKGWNVCTEQQSVDKIHSLAAKNAKYFVAQKAMLGSQPGLEDELRREYPIIADSDEFCVFDLAAQN